MDTDAKENALRKLARMNTEPAKKTLQTHAKKIFDTLLSSNKYEELIGSLELLENFVYRVHEEAIDVLKQFFIRLENLQIEYPKEYHIRYSTNLVSKTLDILYILRFMDVERVSQIILDQLDNPDPAVAKHSIELAKQLASYDLRAINKIGYYPQKVLLDTLKSWGTNTLVKRRESVNIMCREFLEATAKATSSDYKTVTWHTGTLTITDELKEVRKGTIKLLIDLYCAQNDIAERLKVMNSLRWAATLPNQTRYGDDWIEIAKENFAEIATFYLSIFDNCSYLEYQEMEHQIYWFPKRGIKFEDSGQAVSELAEKLSQNEEYQIFKMIMGDDRSFSSYWEDSEWDYKKSREFRKQKIDEYMPQVGADFDTWRKRAISYLEHIDDTSSGVYEFMPYFLKRVAQEYPDHAMILLQNYADQFNRYLPSLLMGLAESALEKAYRISDIWLEHGVHLETIMRCHDVYGDREKEFIEKTLDRAIEVKEVNAQRLALSVLAQKYENAPKFYAELFLKCIKALREENHAWSNWVWFRPEAAKLIGELPEEEIDFLLNALLDQRKLDYHEEDLLRPVARMYPEKVIHFFEERIAKQMKESSKKGIDSNYDAVPHSFHSLSGPLAENASVVMPLVFDWHKRDDFLFRWDGARLMGMIFVNVEGVLQNFLIDKIKNGTKEDATHALSILREYDGNPEILSVCIEAVKKYHNDKDILGSELVCALDATGVVSGEYGFRDAYQGKLSFVDEMMKIDDEGVKAFAAYYKEHLTKRIEGETKRADKDIAVRKKVWGVKENDESKEQ